jgi:hypothetical protein
VNSDVSAQLPITMPTLSPISSPALSAFTVASSGVRCLLRCGVPPSVALARSIAAQRASLTLVRPGLARGGPSASKTNRLLSRSASAFSGGHFGLRASSVFLGAASRLLSSGRCCANPAVKGTAQKLRFWVPSLRSAAPYLERWGAL